MAKQPARPGGTGFRYPFEGRRPVVDPTAFVHPLAVLIGDVRIGRSVYVGPGAVLRGDWGSVLVADGCNIQENCVIHSFPGAATVLEENAHIGHGAVLHGPHIGRNVLVGMNAVVMDNAVIGENTIVGALTLIPSEAVVPAGKVVAGNPYRVLRDASAGQIAWKAEGTRLYQTLPDRWRAESAGRGAGGAGTRARSAGRAPHRGAAARKAKRPGSARAESAYRTWKETRTRRGPRGTEGK